MTHAFLFRLYVPNLTVLLIFHQQYTLAHEMYIVGEDSTRLKLGPVSPLLTGCSECTVYPTGHGVTCVNRYVCDTVCRIMFNTYKIEKQT